MKNLVWGLITLLLTLSSVQAEMYYRSIDSAGNVHYGDKPLPEATDIEKIKAVPGPDANNSIPFEMRRVQEKFPVTLYTAESCGDGCSMARDYLTKRGIPYTETKLLTQEEIDAFKKMTGGNQVPVIQIGKNRFTGFSRSLWGEELDRVGYPRSAPYGFRPPATTTPESPKKE